MRKSLFSIVLLLLAGCYGAPPDALIQAEGATKRKYYTTSGMKVLEYVVQKKYPAEDFIQEMNSGMKKKGWKPLDYVFLFPQYKSSSQTGWSIFRDPPKRPSKVIYEWSQDWQDPQGNLVTYTFRYFDPIEKLSQSVFVLRPGNSELQVTALYMSKAVAESRRAQLNKKYSNVGRTYRPLSWRLRPQSFYILNRLASGIL